MKDQYFGDVNDYQKYGILRILAASVSSLRVVWMLTPSDGRSDGRFTEYLSSPEKWRHFDPVLFDFLKSEVVDRNRRTVQAMEEWDGLEASFWSRIVPDDGPSRQEWWESSLEGIRDPGLLFFDPDNGIEVPSCAKGRKRSSKYVYWDELLEAWQRGSSLLVYQHFPREPREPFVRRFSAEFHRRLSVPLVVVLRTSHVAFFLVPQESWVEDARQAAQRIKGAWRDRVTEFEVARDSRKRLVLRRPSETSEGHQ